MARAANCCGFTGPEGLSWDGWVWKWSWECAQGPCLAGGKPANEGTVGTGAGVISWCLSFPSRSMQHIHSVFLEF
jgi:hypothetical protein